MHEQFSCMMCKAGHISQEYIILYVSWPRKSQKWNIATCFTKPHTHTWSDLKAKPLNHTKKRNYLLDKIYRKDLKKKKKKLKRLMKIEE